MRGSPAPQQPSKTTWIGVLCAAAAVIAAGCRPQEVDFESGLAGHGVILVVVDTLRADHLGTYGYPRDTSPNIDSIAAEGIVFENASSSSSYTREAISTLFSGRLPSTAGSVDWGARPARDTPTLGELFAAAGYRTAFLSTSPALRTGGFDRGFEQIEHLAETWDVRGLSQPLVTQALETVRDFGGEPFFVYLHFLDPHGPYQPPEDMLSKLSGSEAAFPSPIDLYREVRPHCRQLAEEGFGPGDPRFEDLVLRYDAEIADVDRAIGELFSGLESLGVRDRTLLVLTSDHGEEFLEHGYVEHAWTLYQESVHVPLIFWSRQIRSPRRHPARVSHVDLAPTLLELTGIPGPRPEADGRPFFVPAGEGFVFEPPPGPVLAELLIDHRNRVRSVVADDWKYLAAEQWLTMDERSQAIPTKDVPPGELWRPVVHEELYHLASDPAETKNLAASAGAELETLRRLLADYRRHSESLRPSDGEAREPLSEEELEALRSLGYLDG